MNNFNQPFNIMFFTLNLFSNLIEKFISGG